jgi:hypothetical protein
MGGSGLVDFSSRTALEINPSEDIERLNEKVCQLATDPVRGNSVLAELGASPEVASRLHGANEAALATAIRCRVPLLEFTIHLEELIARPARQWKFDETKSGSSELRGLTGFCLCLAHDLSQRNVMVVQKLFSVSRTTAEKVAELSVANRERLANHSSRLIRLRDADDLQVWDLLLIGDRCRDTRALEVARWAVQQSMIRKQELDDGSSGDLSQSA